MSIYAIGYSPTYVVYADMLFTRYDFQVRRVYTEAFFASMMKDRIIIQVICQAERKSMR